MTNRYGVVKLRNVFSAWINRVSDSAENTALATLFKISTTTYYKIFGIFIQHFILNKDSVSVNNIVSTGNHRTNLMQSFYLKLE